MAANFVVSKTLLWRRSHQANRDKKGKAGEEASLASQVLRSAQRGKLCNNVATLCAVLVHEVSQATTGELCFVKSLWAVEKRACL